MDHRLNCRPLLASSAGRLHEGRDSLQLSKRPPRSVKPGGSPRRPLFSTTRRVTVTPEGAAFYERCASILQIWRGEASVMQASLRDACASICQAPSRHTSFQPYRNFLPATDLRSSWTGLSVTG
jgi:hypothetical protein